MKAGKALFTLATAAFALALAALLLIALAG
jgi:hypothetical protein